MERKSNIFFSRKSFASIQKFLDRAPTNALAIGIIFKDGSVGTFYSDGVDGSSLFDIGSVSKTFTAQLILSLAEQGKISLDATVDTYIPLRKGLYPTVTALLTHTAGYGHLTPVEITLPALLTKRYIRANLYRGADRDAVLSALSRRNRAKKGTRYGYSDFAYAVLAVVAENVTGEPFHVLLNRLIRDTYGLKNTSVFPVFPRVPVYLGGKEISPWEWDKENPYIAGGGVVSTMGDMLKYARLQLKSFLPQVIASQKIYPPSFSPRSNTGTCLGWHTYKKSNQLWHVGGVGAFRASVIINRRLGCAVTVLGNAKGGKSANVHYIAKLLYSELKKKRVTPASGEKYMTTFLSDILAGSANQCFFVLGDAPITCRVYYKLFRGGEEYKIYFSDTVDSTFSDGSFSVCNDTCGEWEILSLRAGVCDACGMDDPAEPPFFTAAFFEGKQSKTVSAGEVFSTDTMRISARGGEYLCVEYTLRGHKLPCHPEIQIPAFIHKNGVWEKNVYFPVPSMIGVKRKAEKSVCFLGDSITQGIGATPNGYRHWCAVAADILGTRYAYRNLGIGYARASDTASNGAWLKKAKESDICVLCLGANDILQNASAVSVCHSLIKTVSLLEKAGVQVLVQTVPPFEYPPEAAEYCKKINVFIKNTFSNVFDNTLFLCNEGDVSAPVYGGHPNDTGCRIWGERIAAHIKTFIDNK